MCGISGILNLDGRPASADLSRKMAKTLAHRGPDGEGVYTDGPLGFGHRRLAVIDLSPAGNQPMINEGGNQIIIYNGEIYNFRELRAQMKGNGRRFQSATDTEVALAAYEIWGEACVDYLKGMYAFAIWDREKKKLFLARDRHGIKPLYWTHQGNLFLFGSEVKAILAHPDISPHLSYEALNEYFTFQNVFTDRTLFDKIYLLPPGHTLTIDLNDTSPTPRIKRHWDYTFTDLPTAETQTACAESLYHLFVQRVTSQLVSDVPVGAYLSGGMDSGSLTAVAVRHLPRLTTFTCGFDLRSVSGLELGFDERQSAEALANALKTEHYEVVIHAGGMEWVMPELVWHLEDLRVGQCYPNYYAARLASKFVKVVLSGVGGDELFGGYPWRYYRDSGPLSRENFFHRYYDFWQRLVSDEDKKSLFTSDAFRRTQAHPTFDVFRDVFRNWHGELRNNADFVNASIYFELKTFLHGLLVVEDKLSMAHSLETRVPFLDDDLVDFSAGIPASYRLADLNRLVSIDENAPGKRQLYYLQTSDGKQVLRNAMAKLLPDEIVQRTKQGFSAPDATWFRGESIDYIHRMLKNPKARLREYISPAYIERILDEHCSGKINRRLLIWSLLSFEVWLDTFIP